MVQKWFIYATFALDNRTEPRMRSRPPLKPYQVTLLVLLWVVLVSAILLWGEVNGMSLFSVAASGIIIFVTLYKDQKRR